MQPLLGAVVEADGVGVGLGGPLGLALVEADGELDGLELVEPDGLELALGLALALAEPLPLPLPLAAAEADADADGFLPPLPACARVTPGDGVAAGPPLPLLPAGATWEIRWDGPAPDGVAPPVAEVAGTGFAAGESLNAPETSITHRAAPATIAAPTATTPARRRRPCRTPPVSRP
jgi:hypothetical protein